MIDKSDILQNLAELEKLYEQFTTVPRKTKFFSKLAILELCGWIEESMDGIIRRCANRYLKIYKNREFVEDPIIRRTYGFEYEKYFRNMLMRTVGIIMVEKLETNVDPTKFQIMEATLKTLKESRNKEAHQYIKGTTKQLDAPSKIKSYFSNVYDGLEEIDNHLRQLKL